MAVAAQLEQTLTTGGKSREPRRRLHLKAAGATGAGATSDVLVHNLSATGLLLESRTSLAIGERIEVDLPHAGATWARVVWTSDRLFGCQFDTPISQAALSAAQLRSSDGPQVDLAAPPEESFGGRLQRLRKAQGLTLGQIATKLGVSKPTVWAWERGKSRPVDSRIGALAEALGVSPSEIRSGRSMDGLGNLLAASREQIARAVGTNPEKVRIMIEL